jgi:hypothetical protein
MLSLLSAADDEPAADMGGIRQPPSGETYDQTSETVSYGSEWFRAERLWLLRLHCAACSFVRAKGIES